MDFYKIKRQLRYQKYSESTFNTYVSCLQLFNRYLNSNKLAEYLDQKDMKHVRGRPLHPQTQGKIERYHRSMKNVVKFDNYFSPGQLEVKLKEFVQYYNFERYH